MRSLPLTRGDVRPMTGKERLHQLVEVLPEGEVETATRVIEGLAALAMSDPVTRALELAPEDDEPVSDEDRIAIREGWEDYRAGRGVSSGDVRRKNRDS